MKRRYAWALGMALLGNGALAAETAETANSWTEPATGMPFVAIAKGCFQMGSRQAVDPPADTAWGEFDYRHSLAENEQPRHEACVDEFWIGKYEVRAKEWRAIMGSLAPPASESGENFPIGGVTWEQARRFAQRLSEKSGGQYRFRLPTETEWEYACRAGDDRDAFANQQLLEQVARYGLGSEGMSTAGVRIGEVGERTANRFGLHDMLGNVWEWVEDSYLADGYSKHALFNPRVELPAPQRVIRGGSFRTEFAQVRCARRGHYPAAETLDSIGFRLVRER